MTSCRGGFSRSTQDRPICPPGDRGGHWWAGTRSRPRCGQVLRGEGEWRDPATGCGSRGGLADGGALLVGAVRWPSPACEQSPGGVAAVVRGAKGDLAGSGAEEDADRDRGEIGRSVSMVSREVTRNVGPNGYRAARADRLATARIARPRAGKLADDPILRRYVEDKLTSCWSPQQISRRLLIDSPTMRRCGSRTRRSTRRQFGQTKAILPGELTTRLRTRRVRRRPHRRVTPT
jgi:hypothetical protein